MGRVINERVFMKRKEVKNNMPMSFEELEAMMRQNRLI